MTGPTPRGQQIGCIALLAAMALFVLAVYLIVALASKGSTP